MRDCGWLSSSTSSCSGVASVDPQRLEPGAPLERLVGEAVAADHGAPLPGSRASPSGPATTRSWYDRKATSCASATIAGIAEPGALAAARSRRGRRGAGRSSARRRTRSIAGRARRGRRVARRRRRRAASRSAARGSSRRRACRRARRRAAGPPSRGRRTGCAQQRVVAGLASPRRPWRGSVARRAAGRRARGRRRDRSRRCRERRGQAWRWCPEVSEGHRRSGGGGEGSGSATHSSPRISGSA